MMQLNPGAKPGPTPTTYNVAVENVPEDVSDATVRDTINKTVVVCPYDMYVWDWSDFGKSNFVNYYKKVA
jgi:hypothetical protein